MRIADTLRFAGLALTHARRRTWMMLLAMTIGVGSVVVLITLGEGARRYVADQFSGLGSHLLIVLPGRSETTGGAPPLVGGTPRDLTLEDALALQRSHHIRRIAPIIVGSAPLSHGTLEREITVVGSTAEMLPVRNLELFSGRFLPAGDPTRGGAVTVIGSKLKQELFGNANPLGAWVRIHDRRFRVIGVLAPMGESLGLDVGDIAIIPIATAQSLFDTSALFRILIQAKGLEALPGARRATLEILAARHDGEEDVTVITQDALLATFDQIFRTLTFAVAGIAAVSLAVAGVLIMNVMLIAVSQRNAEIGLLKAIGSPQRQILTLFLVEAALLSLAGAVCGLLVSLAGVWGLGRAFPEFPLVIPPWSMGAAVGVALVTGLLFGALPARRASRLDPVAALTGR